MGIYRKPNSPYWHYSFKLPGRPQQRGSTGYEDRKLAEACYHKKRTEAKENVDFKKPSSLTVSDLLKWANDNHWGYPKLEWQVRAILDCFGEKKAREIAYSEILRFKMERGTKVSAGTVNKELTLFAAAYNYAMKAKMLFENPLASIPKFDCSDRERRKFLTPQEKLDLINGAEGLLQDLIVFALQTGMRQGEILNLKWSDIDFDRGQMRVVSRKGKKIIVRDVPLFDRAESIVKAQPRDNEHVFTDDWGKQLGKYSCVHSSYYRLVKKLGIQGGDFTFHDLRHTFASDYLMAGNSLASLAEILGHRRFDTTRRYAHLSREHKKIGMANMPKLVYDRNAGQNVQTFSAQVAQ